MTENYEEEIDLWEIVAVFVKRKKIILGIIFISLVVSLVLALLEPHKYSAEAVLRVGRAGNSPLEDVSDTAAVVKSLPSLEKIFSRFYGKELAPEDIKGNDSLIEITGRGRMMNIKTFGSSPQKAEELGRIVVGIIMERHKLFYEMAERDLKSYLTNVKVQLRSLQRIIEFSEFSNEPTVVEAEPRSTGIPVNSRRKVVMVGVVLGLLLGIFWAFLQEYLDKKRIAQ